MLVRAVAGWIVEYKATAAPGYRFERWLYASGETEPNVVCDNAPYGGSEYTGRYCRFQIWKNLSTRAYFVDDTAPTMASLSGPAGQVTGTAVFSFAAGADPTFSHFQCRLTTLADSQLRDWTSCATGHQENPGAAGVESGFKLYVRAVDRSNNVSAPLVWTWTVDKQLPETMITSGPSGLVASSTATFEFTSPSADTARYTCTLDAIAIACSSPKLLIGLGQGGHTFSVAAVDDAGNTDASPAVRSWTVDTVAPDTYISSGPSGSTTSTSAQFVVTSSEPAATLQCSLDSAPFAACTSPVQLTSLALGNHTFKVRATDPAGNQDSTPATRTWTVVEPPDVTAPDTQLLSTPPATTTERMAAFTFSSEPNATFGCSLDGAPFAPCVSPHVVQDLALGAHVLQVRATDVAGNVDATPALAVWSIVAPTVIGGGDEPGGQTPGGQTPGGQTPDGGASPAPVAEPAPAPVRDRTAPNTKLKKAPAKRTRARVATFTFLATERRSTFQCKLDKARKWTACRAPKTYRKLKPGVHTFQVRAIDAAKNVDRTPVKYTWRVR